MAMTMELLDGVDHLDPLPITVTTLMTKMADEFVSPREIASVIEYDQAIAATLLRAANSAAMGGRMRIERVGDAVTRLGLDFILNVALGSHMKALAAPVDMYDLSEDDFWLHSAVSSLAAKEITAAAAPAVQIPKQAAIAALMHDIGKLILVRHSDVDLSEIWKLTESEGITFVEAEHTLLGFDHAEVGAAIAEKWGFPEEIRHAIAVHHRVPVLDPTPMTDCVMLANIVAKTVGVGVGAEGMNMYADQGCMRRLGLGFNAFGRICSEVITLMDSLKSIYNA
jgi:putative nucleotidyltransferase with HDIG domain